SCALRTSRLCRGLAIGLPLPSLSVREFGIFPALLCCDPTGGEEWRMILTRYLTLRGSARPESTVFMPNAANVSVQGCIEHPLSDLKDISSPSHPVLIRPGKESSIVELANGSTVPDCDFVVRWTETVPQGVKPAGWVCRRGDDSYALIRLRAPTHVAISETH